MYIIFNSNSKKIWLIEAPNWEGDWHKNFGGSWDCVEAYRIDGHAEGVPYSEELANINGMSFILFCFTSEHDKKINEAKAKINRDRDVVRMRVIRGMLQQQ